MTITVDITPEVQAELARQAAATVARSKRMPRAYSKGLSVFLPALTG
jgi:hypothetical protein